MSNTLPIVGKTYNYFDDGKIRNSRLLKATITDIKPFHEIGPVLLEKWKEEVQECEELYNFETDYFIFADLEISNTNTQKIVFVRTVENGWFSMGWWAGRLDIDNSLTNKYGIL